MKRPLAYLVIIMATAVRFPCPVASMARPAPGDRNFMPAGTDIWALPAIVVVIMTFRRSETNERHCLDDFVVFPIWELFAHQLWAHDFFALVAD